MSERLRPEPPLVEQIEPAQLRERMLAGVPLDIIDVREPWEWSVARIEGARLIPLDAFDEMSSTLDPARDVVLYCHHGMRSQFAAELLVQAGFVRVFNLAGGIERWRLDVDPLMRGY